MRSTSSTGDRAVRSLGTLAGRAGLPQASVEFSVLPLRLDDGRRSPSRRRKMALHSRGPQHDALFTVVKAVHLDFRRTVLAASQRSG